MRRIDLLRKRRDMLKEQIRNNFDLLMGTVVRSPAMMYHSLTTKVEGKTVTLCEKGACGQSKKNDRTAQKYSHPDSKTI